MLKRNLGDKIEMRHGPRRLVGRRGAPARVPIVSHCIVDSEHPLFTLYTTGTTGKPKGVVHTTGGYLTHLMMTMKWVFDLKEEDIYWCTADVGWITGHSYVVYGPLAAGGTVMMYEGAPNFPENDRFWAIIEKYRVNILYTAPTAIRTFIKWGEQWATKHDLSSLRLLGTVGEPINPEAWMWYHKVIGGERCPIVDTWWQTETGGILIAPMPVAIATKPGFGDSSAAGRGGRSGLARGRYGGSQSGRTAGGQAAVAGNAADDLSRSRTLPPTVLQPDRWHVLHWRWRPA